MNTLHHSKHFILYFILFLSFSNANAQDCIPHDEILGQCCREAINGCFDNVCFETTNDPPCDGTMSPNFCGNNTVLNNPQFFRLVIEDFPVTIDVEVFNCTAGTPGLQMATATACPMDNGNNIIDCIGIASFEWSTSIEASSGLQINDEIFLIIDGFAGSICEFTLDITNTVKIPLAGLDPSLTGDLESSDIQLDTSTIYSLGQDSAHFGVALNNIPYSNQLIWNFSWAPEDTLYSGVNGIFKDIPANIDMGTYEVCVSATNFCNEPLEKACVSFDIKESIVSINEIKNSPFEIYPNPIQGSINIYNPEFINKKCLLKLYHANGALVDYKSIESNIEDHIFWQQHELPSGVYFLQVMYGGETFHEKIVKP